MNEPHAATMEATRPLLPRGPIVLVDDDELLRTALVAILERAGFTVHATVDGEQALRFIEKNPVSLVITDLIMPQIEGIELIVRLRKSRPDLKIIAISGGGRVRPETFLGAAKSLGAWKVMSKPFSTPDLIAAIHEALETTPGI
jgi:DNA-binding NtrC family response regulator